MKFRNHNKTRDYVFFTIAIFLVCGGGELIGNYLCGLL